MIKPVLLRVTMFVSTAASLLAANVILPAGSTWRYWDGGSEPFGASAASWKEPGFVEQTGAEWSEGAGELGYGDGDEATVVSYGPNASAKYITTYFRKTFSVADPSAYSGVSLRLWRDDGAVVYLNGVEVGRVNMPSTGPSYSTLASSAIEETMDLLSLPAALLNAGENLLAVEIHQAGATSSDISFDLELTGEGMLARGPYLQLGTAESVVLRWRTAAPTNSVVKYRGAPDGSTWAEVRLANATTEHEVTVSGLQANTGYYYSIETETQALASGEEYIFYTAPAAGTAAPIRIWALGDSGTADANAAAVRDAYYQFAPTRYTDLLLMLGDNAYNNGLDSEYQIAVFDMYPEILQQTVLWPTIGNHDTAGSTTVNSDLPYFSMFTLPTHGEAGGESSGTEKYYSFNYGNVHFVCLDSMTSSRQSGSAMLTWLEADLAANTLPWVIAFWHHPPYSKGSHDSDNTGADYQMVEMRQNVVPILDAYNVDLILGGHSHSYERSYLLAGHYGFSGSLEAGMKLDAGSGREDGAGSYNKLTGATTAFEGAVYIVAGSSGKKSGGPLNHPAMFLSLNELGSLVVDVDGNKLDVKFLRENGIIQDYFSIVKGNERPVASITSPASGAVFVEPNIVITAEASDSDGSIVAVDFLANESLLGSDASAPYEWDWSEVPFGNHSIVARARDDKGVTGMSEAVSVSIAEPAPVAPANLIATASSGTQIMVAWSDLSGNESGFQIERSTDGSSFVLVATVAANTTSYTDVNLAASTQYFYRASAFNSGGVSPPSNIASVTTLDAAPLAPANLEARAVSKSQIDLAWTDESANESGFRVELKSKRSQWTIIATLPANVTSFSHTGLSANTVYAYRVQAFNQVGMAASNEASAKTPRK